HHGHGALRPHGHHRRWPCLALRAPARSTRKSRTAEMTDNNLRDHLIRLIRETGPLPLSHYMALCLGHREHGYYMTRDPLGAKGDFTTAPDVSQMFGELVGLWLADCWLSSGAPKPFVLAELGPGRGTLMADALRALRPVPGMKDAASIHFVETSPALRAAQ